VKRKELLALIEQGENLCCEFKLRFSSYEKLAKEITAFANTKGGYLIFGVDDDKNIIGVESEKEITEIILEAAQKYCEPPIDVNITSIDFHNKEIVIADIKESANKPHRIQDYLNELNINSALVYVRINDKSVQASREMIRVLRSKSGGNNLKKYFIGNMEKTVFDYLEKNETINVEKLCSLANISERRASRTLVKMVRANILLIHTKDNGEDYFTFAGNTK
jgi:predicted HTH transcriptional regulator